MIKSKAKKVFKEIKHLQIMYKDIPANEFIFIEPIEKAFKQRDKEVKEAIDKIPQYCGCKGKPIIHIDKDELKKELGL